MTVDHKRIGRLYIAVSRSSSWPPRWSIGGLLALERVDAGGARRS